MTLFSSLLPTPASLLLLLPLLVGVSPVQISRLTAAANSGRDGGEARYDGGARPVPPWPHPYWDIPGEYCKAEYPSGQCCPGRQDRCSVPILGTLCYCDTFCNRTQNADCCPDYFPHCLGMGRQQFEALEPPRPQSISRPRDCRHGILNITNPMCEYKGASYSDRDTIQDNCNTCSCQVSKTKPGCMEVLCTTSQCLVEGEVVEELREGEGRGLYTWRPANYTQFWGRSLEEGVRGKLGALRPHAMLQHMSAIQFSYTPASLPTQFDSRKEWPGLVSPVRDQGWCSSSWALATAQVAGDRVSVGKGRLVELSPQTLLSCDTAPQAGCRGGHVDRAWGFLRHHGVWPERCLPYSSGAGEVGVCPAQSSCIGQEVHMQPAYRVGREGTSQQPRRREQDIMHEIQINGPVQAVMEVYTDFFMYSSGVYSPTNLARATVAGYHAVRILGWGQEGGQRHWLVANSWGDQWGEGGLFRLQRGENTCQIEEFVLGSWPQERKTGGRRRRRRRHRGSQGLRRTRHGRRPHREQGRERSSARKHYFQVG